MLYNYDMSNANRINSSTVNACDNIQELQSWNEKYDVSSCSLNLFSRVLIESTFLEKIQFNRIINIAIGDINLKIEKEQTNQE